MKEHPRLAQLRAHVHNLPLDAHCRAVLLQSIDYLSEPIVARHDRAKQSGRGIASAPRLSTPSGMMERALHEHAAGLA